MNSGKPTVISVVTTLYYSAPYIEEFYQRMTHTVRQITEDYEIIFVNDGSPDHSLEALEPVWRSDPRVKVIDLSRNFGHHRAIMTGLEAARGEWVFLIDIDLEEVPEILLDFWPRIQSEENCDVIYGRLQKRKGGLFERVSGRLYYWIQQSVTDEKIPGDTAFSRLMSRRYVTSLCQFREREIYIAGLWHITGFKQVPVDIVKTSKGSSTYSFRRKLTLAINGLVSFSNRPLELIFYSGLFISFSSILYIIFLIYKKLTQPETLLGWTSLIATISLSTGLIIFFLGIIGIYLSKIFIESKQRPYTIIRDVFQQSSPVEGDRDHHETES